MTSLRVFGLVTAVLFAAAIGRLAYLDNAGPQHSAVELPGHEPATLYFPRGNSFFKIIPPPPAERPPAVVLVHGFMSDRQMMSVLARRIAENGYAVLAIDVRGHGENRNAFSNDFSVGGALREDVKQAVDFLRGYPFVDGARIAVIGHSMGAGAVLDYATHDRNLSGAVMISGGWSLGPERPRNALFIFAENDPEEAIQDTSTALAAHLAGVGQVQLGQLYGGFAGNNAIEAMRIPGVDHIRILYSEAAATAIVKWLDGAFGTNRTGDIETADARLGASLIALVLFLVLLVPLGRICGSIAPQWPERVGGAAGWIGILVFAATMILAMPLAAMIQPASFVPFVVGDIQASWLAVAGLIAILLLTLSGTLNRRLIRDRIGFTIFAGAIGFAVVYVCMVALSVTFHRLSLTPERLIAGAIVTVLTLPFWVGFEFLVRRGGSIISTVLAVLGRAVILLLMGLGIAFGVLPPVMMLVLPSLTLVFVMIEIFAASAYSSSRNLILIALVEASWFAWMIAATNPITFMF